MARGYRHLFWSDPHDGDISTRSVEGVSEAFQSSGKIIAARLGYPDDLSFYNAQSSEGAGRVFVTQLEEFARDWDSPSDDETIRECNELSLGLLFQYFQEEDEFNWEESRDFFLTKYEEHS